MQVQILSPQGILYQGKDITAITLPGSKGEFMVLKGHAAIISTLSKGNVRVQPKGEEEQSISVAGGFVEVLNDVVSVCVY